VSAFGLDRRGNEGLAAKPVCTGPGLILDPRYAWVVNDLSRRVGVFSGFSKVAGAAGLVFPPARPTSCPVSRCSSGPDSVSP
jgi:hypothetical protein